MTKRSPKKVYQFSDVSHETYDISQEMIFNFIGKEYEDDLVLCYLEIEEVSSIQSIEILNKIYKENDSQIALHYIAWKYKLRLGAEGMKKHLAPARKERGVKLRFL